MPPVDDPALTFAVALAAGIIAQSVAIHLRVPGIVLLLATGVLLGPDLLGVVRPDALGDGLRMIVGLAVAVVLFEGGLSLNIRQLRTQARTIRRLVTVGALVTAALAAVAARLCMGWAWSTSILFGTLVIVTGPTVITPLLRRIRVQRRVGTILEAEGVMIDPIGAIVAVVALEVVLATAPGEAAADLLGFPGRFAVGGGLGLVGGALIGLLLHYEGIVPEGLENVFTLALVLALYKVSEATLPESGILAAVVAGMVVANLETRLKRELKEFKEQLTVLLIGLLFVLLAADVRIAQVTALGWPAAATVLALMLVVRPLDVAVSTWGSDLSWRERTFLSWIAPRGIVAAAVASLFAQGLDRHGREGGPELLAMVFLVIAATVVVQGGTAGLVARWLGLRRDEAQGFLLIGANPVARAVARALVAEGEEVVLVDTNAAEAQAAQQEGLRVVYGNANEERTLLQADVEARRGFVAVTPNEAVNLLLADRARNRHGVSKAYVALRHRRLGVQEEQVREVGASLLFGVPLEMAQWGHELVHGDAVVEAWRLVHPRGDRAGPVGDGTTDVGEGEAEEGAPEDGTADAPAEGGLTGEPSPDWSLPRDFPILPLVLARGRSAAPVDETVTPREGDRVHFAWLRRHDRRARAWLRREGWEPDLAPAASETGDGAEREEAGSRSG